MAIYPFTPSTVQNFAFQPTLDATQYSAVVAWSLFGQRWVLELYTLAGVLVMQKPLAGSPQDYDINLIQGYGFISTLVFREASNAFEVVP